MASRGRTARAVWLGSVKTNLGHLEAAAGIAGLIKAVLSLRIGAVPPHLHFRRLNPRITLSGTPFAIPTVLTAWPAGAQPRRAAVSAFGFGGTNAHVILEEGPALSTAAAVPVPGGPQLLTLSARTPAALAELAGRYAGFLAASDAPDWGAVCATSHQGRSHFGQRLALVAPDAATAAERLARWQTSGQAPGVHTASAHAAPKVAFLFPGQGVGLAGVGQALYAHYPVFRDALDRCAALLAPHLEADLKAVLWAAPDSPLAAVRAQTAFIQPALVALEWALSEQLAAWGVRPSAVLGHSVGEYAAAVVAGALRLEDGLRLAAERGRLMQALPAGGAMTSVEADEQWVQSLLARLGSEAVIAAVNAPRRVVVAGTSSEVAEVEAACAQAGVRAERLKVSHAFHSPLMEPMQAEFADVLAGADYRPAQLPLVSTVSGRLVGAAEVLDAGYWRGQVLAPVQFGAGVQALAQLGCQVLVEVGPGGQLSGLGQLSWPDGHEAAWVTVLRGKTNEIESVLAGLGQLYTAGVPIAWAEVDGPTARRAVLPTYPFQRQRYWVDSAVLQTTPADNRDEAPLPLLGQRVETALDSEVYETQLSLRRLAYLEDHQLFGTVVLPGAYYVALAMAAARRGGRSTPYRLDDLLFHKFLKLGADEEQPLQLILAPGAPSADGPDAGQDFRIFSRSVEDGAWALHATGRLRAGVDEPPPLARAEVSLGLIQGRCREQVDPAGFYAEVEARGLELGPAFRWIEQLWRGAGEAQSLGSLRQKRLRDPTCGNCPAWWTSASRCWRPCCRWTIRTTRCTCRWASTRCRTGTSPWAPPSSCMRACDRPKAAARRAAPM